MTRLLSIRLLEKEAVWTDNTASRISRVCLLRKKKPMQSLGILVACVALPWTVSGLKIGTFNVKVFGPKKLQDRTNVDVLCKVCCCLIHANVSHRCRFQIVSRYDVLLIEEIRSKIDGVIPTLLGYVNK